MLTITIIVVSISTILINLLILHKLYVNNKTFKDQLNRIENFSSENESLKKRLKTVDQLREEVLNYKF
jgi:hypothetical protein